MMSLRPRPTRSPQQQRGLLVSVVCSIVLLVCFWDAKTAQALQTSDTAEAGVRLRLQQLLQEAAEAKYDQVLSIAITPQNRLISTGNYVVCQLNRGNFVQCWGGDYGASPLKIATSLTDITGITTGGFQNTCAWNQSAVECWRAIQVDCGTRDGEYKCWGEARMVAKWTAQDLSGPIVDFAFSEETYCAISGQDNLVRCWGVTADGELGIGIKFTAKEKPTLIHSPSGVQFQQVRSKGKVFCAVSTNGDVYCWGAIGCWRANQAESMSCAFSFDAQAWASTPTKIEGLPGRAKSVEIGSIHVCVLLENSNIYCFGSNWAGQLGLSTTSFNSWKPVKVQFDFYDVKLIACGRSATYAVLGNGDVVAWGGFGGAPPSYDPRSRKPVQILSSEPGSIVSISCSARSEFNCCVRYSNKGSQCWGETYGGMLGDGVSGAMASIAFKTVQPVDVLNG